LNIHMFRMQHATLLNLQTKKLTEKYFPL